MMTAFGWVMFGMAIWGLCIFMEALERRFAPESGVGRSMGLGRRRKRRHKHAAEPEQTVDSAQAEIAELKKRIETLEAIVTDSRFQWEQEYNRGR